MVPPQETVDSDQEMEDAAETAEPEDSNGVGAVSSEAPGPVEERGEDPDVRPVSDHYVDSNMAEGGYECKYCSFQTAELNLFTMHVDTEHPDVVINTSYVCMECDYHTKRYNARVFIRRVRESRAHLTYSEYKHICVFIGCDIFSSCLFK